MYTLLYLFIIIISLFAENYILSTCKHLSNIWSTIKNITKIIIQKETYVYKYIQLYASDVRFSKVIGNNLFKLK